MKKRFYQSIYFRFGMVFIVILLLSSVLSGIFVSLTKMDDIQRALEKQIRNKAQLIQVLVVEENLSLYEIVTYFDENDMRVRIYEDVNDILENPRFSNLKNHTGDLDQGKAYVNISMGKRKLPYGVIHVQEGYVLISPELNNDIAMFLHSFVGTTTGITIFIGILLITLVVSMVIKPIRSLTLAANEVAKGNFDVSLPVKGKDEIADLSRSFNMMAQELGRNEILRKDFVSSFSHEFKTPISSILGFAKLLKKKAIEDEERVEYANIIISESERLSKLSINLLRLSSLEHQAIVHKETPYSLDEQIRDVLVSLQNQWEEKDLVLDLDLDEIQFRGDEELLHQVWLNLISNSIKFTEQKGEIKLSLKRKDQGILFTQTDDGIGMNEEVKNRMFERFYKGDSSRNGKGTGLGLAIAKKIIALHGGDIQVESKVGEGSTFYVWLPVD